MVDKIVENAKKEMTRISINAMEGRNGMDTSNNIPRKLKSLAYDLYDREKCSLCGATSNLHLHHTAPEVKEYIKNYNKNNSLDPYKNTEAWQLVPLCPSCHRKIENNNFNLMNRTLWWLALKKAGEYNKNLEKYLEERNLEIAKHKRTPLNKDFWE